MSVGFFDDLFDGAWVSVNDVGLDVGAVEYVNTGDSVPKSRITESRDSRLLEVGSCAGNIEAIIFT